MVQFNRASGNHVVAYALGQLVLTIVLASLWYLYDFTAAYSALTGGLIATLASSWFAYKVFTNRHVNEPVLALRAMYWGEINKIIFTGAMFVAAFVLIKPVNGAALLAVYFLVHISPVAVDYFKQPKRRRENLER